MTVNIPGVISLVVFYLLILAIGIWAAWRRRKLQVDTEEAMLAGRSIGPFVGLCTLIASRVGGGYINGSAVTIYTSGLFWCHAPIGYSIALSLGGCFFAKKMRDAGYVTMIDPFQDRFGTKWGSFMFLPALVGEIMWSAAVLATLGSTLEVILGIDSITSILISATVVVTYTLFGGLASVAYTDVVQLFCIFIGLWFAIPFAWTNEHVTLSLKNNEWLGSFPTMGFQWGEWIDVYIMLMLGGIPWQVYFQRILSARNSKQAQVLSFAASLGCIIMVIPAVIIGAIAKATDWKSTGLGAYLKDEQSSIVLPLVLQYLTPTWVSFMGLGALCAAVMSSADSLILSVSTMFARNIYKNLLREKASEREVVWVMRVAVVVVAGCASFIAIKVHSVYALFALCAEIVFVILFPQLTMTVHFPKSVNIYGSIVAYWTGLIIRLLGGYEELGIPAVIKFPYFDEKRQRQYFPFRTLSMLVTLFLLVTVSWLVKYLFKSGKLKMRHDILNQFGTGHSGKNDREAKCGRGFNNPTLNVNEIEL